jgi:hypothetical protein
MPFNGILGLGFYKNSNSNLLRISKTESILDLFLLKKILKENIFSFYLNNRNKEKYLLLGKIDESIISNSPSNSFNFADLSYNHKFLWKIDLAEVIINNINICEVFPNKRCQVVIDSGTSFYSAPRRFVSRIKNLIEFHPLCQNYDFLPEITLKFKQSKFSKVNKNKYFNLTLTREDYITQKPIELDIDDIHEKVEMNKCEIDFNYNNSEDTIILGLKFLKRYYTIFDFERMIIGFTQYEKKLEKSLWIIF